MLYSRVTANNNVAIMLLNIVMDVLVLSTSLKMVAVFSLLQGASGSICITVAISVVNGSVFYRYTHLRILALIFMQDFGRRREMQGSRAKRNARHVLHRSAPPFSSPLSQKIKYLVRGKLYTVCGLRACCLLQYNNELPYLNLVIKRSGALQLCIVKTKVAGKENQ